MYLIGIFIFMVLLGVMGAFSAGAVAMIDFPSLVAVLGLTMPILMASGLMPDFINGFRLMGARENPFTAVELRRIEQANRLALRALLLSGLLGTGVGVVGLLSQAPEGPELMAGLSVALLTTLYAVALGFIILPVQARVRAVLSLQE